MPPRVAIIIPHYNGWELLSRCLASLAATDYRGYRTYLVDNGSSDGSPELAQRHFPWLQVIGAPRNLGFAGGCNLGIRATAEEYLVLLNNDTEVEPGWLGALIGGMDADPDIAAAQPKIRWLRERDTFDYSGGAGGLMDVFGHPYCRGRLFETLERDAGQYDGADPNIFWASGSASLYRRSALERVGLLDEDFFMHMEEIDLAWRLQLAGFRVVAAPGSIVYHLSGGSLPAGSFTKMYLNHRNSLLMLLKNYSLPTLLWAWPARALLELMAFAKAATSGNWQWARAIVLASSWQMEHYKLIVDKHHQVQQLRQRSDREVRQRMYRGSIAIDYFLRGRRTAADLEAGHV